MGDTMTATDWPMTAEEILAAIDARPEKWHVIGSCKGRAVTWYEVSDKGGVRSLDREVNGRRVAGQPLSTKPGSSGYPKVSITADDGTRLHAYVHALVLVKFGPRCAGGIPAGMEARHGPAGPLCAAIENLTIGTHDDNENDKPEPYKAPLPTFPCLNAPRCEGLAAHEGKRCTECSTETGRQIALMLQLGMSLPDAAARFGFSEKWAHDRARTCGGYTADAASARAQRPSWSQRVRIRRAERAGLIPRRPRGDGQ
jgi:hypothetical protein